MKDTINKLEIHLVFYRLRLHFPALCIRVYVCPQIIYKNWLLVTKKQMKTLVSSLAIHFLDYIFEPQCSEKINS